MIKRAILQENIIILNVHALKKKKSIKICEAKSNNDYKEK